MATAAHDDLTRIALAHALLEYGQYHETVALDDSERCAQLGRLGREVASEMGIEVSSAAVPTDDGAVHVCLLVVNRMPEPEPAA
ncbi:hypothetical protein [Nocardioides panacisoli]